MRLPLRHRPASAAVLSALDPYSVDLLRVEHIVVGEEVRPELGVAARLLEDDRMRSLRQSRHGRFDEALHLARLVHLESVLEKGNKGSDGLEFCGVIAGHEKDAL